MLRISLAGSAYLVASLFFVWGADTNESIITSLFNFGGVGVLALTLFYLYTNSMKSFRDDLSAERKQCHDNHMDMIRRLDDRHSDVTRKIDDWGNTLIRRVDDLVRLSDTMVCRQGTVPPTTTKEPCSSKFLRPEDDRT